MKNVLLVEDEAIIRFDILLQLESMGFNVFATAYAEESIEIAKKEDIHLVIMDVMLAGEMDGIEAAKIISSYNIPIIFCTARPVNSINDQNLPFEYAILKKPFNKEELEYILRNF